MNDEKVSIQDEISIFFKGLDYPNWVVYKITVQTFQQNFYPNFLQFRKQFIIQPS